MKKLYFYNGEYSDRAPAVSLENRALYFGDGIYDAVLGKGSGLFWADEHVRRFFKNAEALGLPCPFGEKELGLILSEGVKRFGDGLCFVYFSLMRTSGERAHAYGEDAGSDFLAVFSEIAEPDRDWHPDLVTAQDLRYRLCRIKTLNLLPNVMAATEAKRRGADEAVFIRDGFVTEGTHSNVSIVKGNELVTHPNDDCILPGVTKAHLIRHAKELGFAVCERPFTVGEAYEADGVIMTSTSKLAVLCRTLDGKPLPPPSERAKLLCDALFNEYFSRFGNRFRVL